MEQYTKLIIWSAIVVVVFAVMWRKGMLAKLAAYFAGTREELKKCSWPTKPELWASTVVVLVATLLVGGYTVVADLIIGTVVKLILSVS